MKSSSHRQVAPIARQVASIEAPELSVDEHREHLVECVSPDLQVRELDFYDSGELLSLQLAIGIACECEMGKKGLGEKNLRLLDVWSTRISTAMRTAMERERALPFE